MTIVRNCGAGDYAKVLEIYNHYVEHSHATFDLHRFSVGERVPWFSQFAETGPHQLLVADRDREVAGYCSSTPFRNKPAYDVSVETTVYVSPAALHEEALPAADEPEAPAPKTQLIKGTDKLIDSSP